jgi:hypothetical protein
MAAGGAGPAAPGAVSDVTGVEDGGRRAYARASEVERQQQELEARRGQAHMAQIDYRQQQQLMAAGAQPQPPIQPPPSNARPAKGGGQQRAPTGYESLYAYNPYLLYYQQGAEAYGYPTDPQAAAAMYAQYLQAAQGQAGAPQQKQGPAPPQAVPPAGKPPRGPRARR